MWSAWRGTSGHPGRPIASGAIELGEQPPYRTDDKVLFVCFVGNAELGCHLALGWPLPANVLDLSPEFRCLVNGRTAPEGKGLLGALAYFGLDTIGSKRKDDLRKRIMQGWPFTDEERAEILDYCATDVDAMVRLLPKLLPHIDLPIALYRGAFVATLGADGACRRADRHGDIPAARRQAGVAVRARRDGAGDRRDNTASMFAATMATGISTWSSSPPIWSATESTGRSPNAASSAPSARHSRT